MFYELDITSIKQKKYIGKLNILMLYRFSLLALFKVFQVLSLLQTHRGKFIEVGLRGELVYHVSEVIQPF